MEESDTYSDTNSELTVVSNDTLDSDTSNSREKLDKTKDRLTHYLGESKNTRDDFKALTGVYNDYLKKASSHLTYQDKLEYDLLEQTQANQIKDMRKALEIASGSRFNRRIKTNITAGQISNTEGELFALRKQYLDEKLGNNLPDKAAVDSTAEAHTNLSRDILTLSENLNKLSDKNTILSKAVGKLPKQETEGESSAGVKRNREVSSEQEVNATKQQKTTAGSSLLDDYADVSSEMPDYFGFDD